MKHFRQLVCAAAMTAAFLPAAAHAAPQPEVLAYDDGDIFVSAPAGSPGARAVIGGNEPAVSPDGSRLAWEALATDGYPHIFVSSIGGGAGVQVTSGPAYDAQPAWSPDGSRLALTRFVDGGDSHLAVVDADGSNGQVLDALGTAPTWSPDGRLLAFRHPAGLGSVGADGRGYASLGSEQGQPSWSPDGLKIATVSQDVRMVDVVTHQATMVLQGSDVQPYSFFEDATFNAAGDRLYARRVEILDKADFSDEIRRYALDGTQDTTFTPIAVQGYDGAARRLLSVGGGDRPALAQTMPKAPPSVTATVTPSRVLLGWTRPDPMPPAGFTVRYAVGSTPPATPSDGTAAGDTLGLAMLVGRLAPSTTYSFSVFSRDWSGATSAATTKTVTMPAQVATTLTLTGPGAITYGQSSVLSGQLIREDTGAPLGDYVLALLGHHTGQPDTQIGTVTTDSNGRFSTRRRTSEATRYTAVFVGAAPLLRASGTTLVLVRQRITITFSPSSHAPAYSVATVTATVAPAFPGGNVRVQQISFSGHSLLTKLNRHSQVTVRLDTSRRDATARLQVTPGARTGYLADPVEAPFQIT